jgi:hypothetical protein
VAATPQEVAAWKQEQKAETDRLEVLRRAQAPVDEHERALRAQDPGAIKDWLVLAPLPFADGSWEGSVKALDQEQIPGEGALRARAGDRVKMGASELVWGAFRQEDYVIDFNHILGAQTDASVAYAMCYIRSESDKTGLLMKVGSDDQAKVYLNGKEIYRAPQSRNYKPDEDVVKEVELRAGLNVLVFKVVNLAALWQGSVRFTDTAGQPVKGITVSLDPGEPSRP